MFKHILILSLFFFLAKNTFAHSVQVVYCSSCTGDLVLWVEHWHSSEAPGSTTMDIDLTINGVTTRISGSPEENLQNTAFADLPDCATPATIVSQCGGSANTYNDWVKYSFPQVPCGTDVSIKIIRGNTVFTADCGGMYPATTGTFQVACPTPPIQLPNVEACAGDLVPSITFPNSSQPGVNYEWKNDNVAIGLPTAGNGDIPAFNSPPSTVTETANINVVQGCNENNFTLIINPQPDPIKSVTNNSNLNPTGAPLTTCVYDLIYFQNQSTIETGTIQSLLWDFGDGGPTSAHQSPAHKYATDGTYNVTLTTTSAKGCVNSAVFPVVINPVPVAHILQRPTCLYDSVQFEDSSTIKFPDYIDQTILNFGDGSPLGQTINPRHLYPAAGTYNTSYIVISNHGCIDNTSSVVKIYTVPVANYTFDVVCENSGITSFSNSSTISTGSVTGWQWDFDDPVNGVSTLPNPQHDYSEDGIYKVELVVKSDKGCFDTVVQNVRVLPKPTTIFTSNITEACADACIDFLDFSISNATVVNYWEWSLDGGDTSYLQNPSKCYTNISNTEDSLFSISLVTRNDLGCFDSIKVENYIAAWHNPISDFEVDPELTNIYLSGINHINNSIGEDFYSWDFGDGTYSWDSEPYNTYKDSGTYEVQLIVETIHGCMDTSYRYVRVDPVVSIYIPNTFTPNGDGENDTFFFKHYAIIEETVDFKIFDKWGTLIYFTDGINPWDGTYKNEMAKEDTYVYKFSCVDFFGKEHNETGHVNLLR